MIRIPIKMKEFLDLLPANELHVQCCSNVYRVKLDIERSGVTEVPILILQQVIPSERTPMAEFEEEYAVSRIVSRYETKNLI